MEWTILKQHKDGCIFAPEYYEKGEHHYGKREKRTETFTVT